MQGDTTHWSSASSPEEGSSPLDVGSYMASGDSAPTLRATAKGILPCGFMCHGKDKSGRGGSCRKMIKNHARGAVCPDCMGESLFLQCSEGCHSYVHVGCADSAPWTCDKCRAKPQEPEQVRLCTAKFSVRRKGDSEAWQAPLLVAHQVGSTSYLCLYNHH